MPQGAQPLIESRPMTERDLAALRGAVAALEHPSLAARLAHMAGKPIELIGSALPASAAQAIQSPGGRVTSGAADHPGNAAFAVAAVL